MNNEKIYAKLVKEYCKFCPKENYLSDLSDVEDEEYWMSRIIRDIRENNPKFKNCSLSAEEFVSYIRSICDISKDEYVEIMEYAEYAVEIARYNEKTNKWNFVEQIAAFDTFNEAESFIEEYDDEVPEGCELRILAIEYDIDGNETGVHCVY